MLTQPQQQQPRGQQRLCAGETQGCHRRARPSPSAGRLSAPGPVDTQCVGSWQRCPPTVRTRCPHGGRGVPTKDAVSPRGMRPPHAPLPAAVGRVAGAELMSACWHGPTSGRKIWLLTISVRSGLQVAPQRPCNALGCPPPNSRHEGRSQPQRWALQTTAHRAAALALGKPQRRGWGAALGRGWLHPQPRPPQPSSRQPK